MTSLGPLVITKSWPVPTNPDLNALAVPLQEMPRILSADIHDGQLEIKLDMRLYLAYGVYVPDSGNALSARFKMEDDTWAYAAGDEIVAATADQDVWVCEAPEGAVSATVVMNYNGFFEYRYQSAGDGIWHVTLDEDEMRGEWTYAEDGTIAETTYYYDEGYTIYDFTYEEGTNQLMTVWCALNPNCSATFDCERHIVSACCNDRMLRYIDWTPENGWTDSDGEAIDHQCAVIGDPKELACPVDLNTPQHEPGWFANIL